MDDDPMVDLIFKRSIMEGLPERLEALLKIETDKKRREGLLAAVKLFRGLLATSDAKFKIGRTESKWHWLEGAAKVSGAFAFAKVLRWKLSMWAFESEAKKERREFDDRTRAAMAEFVAPQ